ncbi:4-sulfomuconolactone hydrolase [compost metagenome]
MKISGMQKFAAHDHLDEQAGAYVRALLLAFGPDACVWGSDWPFIREQSRVDYGPLLKLAEQLMPDSGVRRKVMWDTPRRLFGFGERSTGFRQVIPPDNNLDALHLFRSAAPRPWLNWTGVTSMACSGVMHRRWHLWRRASSVKPARGACRPVRGSCLWPDCLMYCRLRFTAAWKFHAP